MPTDITRGSSLEFVAALFDSLGNPVLPPIGIYLQVAYTDTSGSTQAGSAFLRGLDDHYVGYWTVPSAMTGTGVMTLTLTASGAFTVSPPDPYLRIVG